MKSQQSTKLIDKMKVICNGFNLYNQLNNANPLLETLTTVFETEKIQSFCINHSFSVFQVGQKSIKVFPEQNVNDFENKIVSVTSNNERILVLDETGKLYKINIENINEILVVPNFLLSDHKDEVIKTVKCGSRITVAYTNRGSLYNVPNRLKFENTNIIDKKCGKEHCLLLDETGSVYSFGRGSRGQLGHGKIDDEVEPELIEALAGLKIIKIAAGGWHSCAVSKDGDLYTWGWNGNGQLGIGKNDDDEENSKIPSVMASPSVVDFPNADMNVAMVACGSRHTVVLSDCKQLFGAGWNKYKQIKNYDKENYFQFSHVLDLEEEVINIECGPWNTAILLK